jgi:hypothetical protein
VLFDGHCSFSGFPPAGAPNTAGSSSRENRRDKRENPLGQQPEEVAIIALFSATYLRGSGWLGAHEPEDVAGGNDSA